MVKACSNSRRTKASSVHKVGGCAGVVGALLANGDSTALTKVDRISAGLGVPTAFPGSCTAARESGTDVAAGVAAPRVNTAGGVVNADGCTTSATTWPATRLLPTAVVSPVAAVNPAGVRVAVAAAGRDPGAAVAINPVPESERKTRGALAFGVADVAVVLPEPVDRVEVDSTAAGVGAADTDRRELVCGPPVATITPGAPECVRLTSPIGETEAAEPLGLDRQSRR